MPVDTAIIGFFTSLDILANMVSIGTLFAFYMVAASLLFYRLYDGHTSTRRDATLALTHLFLITAASLGAHQVLSACPPGCCLHGLQWC